MLLNSRCSSEVQSLYSQIRPWLSHSAARLPVISLAARKGEEGGLLQEPLWGPWNLAGENVLQYLSHGSDGCYLMLGEGGSPLHFFDSTENSGESKHIDDPIWHVSIFCARSWAGMGWRGRMQNFTHA